MKRLCIVTDSRAEWGLLEPLAKELIKNIDLKIIATGSHLSNKHGWTINDISFPVHSVECVLASDTSLATCKGMSLALLGFAEYLSQNQIDGIVLLGDRWEILSAAITAHIMQIPIFHVHGGEESGNYDNAFRHAISHMASYHFVACENYGDRLENFGISKDKIFNVGALGCDGLFPQPYPRKDELFIIYHPETLQREEDFEELLLVLKERAEEKIFIFPNVDDGHSRIADLINNFCVVHIKSNWFVNIDRQKYLEILGKCRVIIGNSSSGIIEAPALGTPTINIGKRQQGRLRAASIIDCDCNAQSIKEAFDIFYSNVFQQMIQSENYYKPYGGENVAFKIAEIILNVKP